MSQERGLEGNLSHVANWRRIAALMLERSGKINASFGIFASLVKEKTSETAGTVCIIFNNTNRSIEESKMRKAARFFSQGKILRYKNVRALLFLLHC